MGATNDANAYNHNRYTDAEAQAAATLVDTNAGTVCTTGQVLDGDGACVSSSGHDHLGQAWSGAGGLSIDNSLGTLDNSALIASGAFGPTLALLALQGSDDQAGIPDLDLAGNEIGVLGISNGASVTDNIGVYGYSNGKAGFFQGDVEVTGTLTTDTLEFAAPRVRTLSIPGASFRPDNGNYMPDYFLTTQRGPGYGGSASAAAMLVAPAALPDGAVVTEFKTFFYDASVPDDLTSTLKVHTLTSDTVSDMASVSTSGQTFHASFTDSSIVSPTVDTDTKGNAVWVSAPTGWGGTPLTVQGALITYTINEL
jgi:hypothetical protein